MSSDAPSPTQEHDGIAQPQTEKELLAEASFFYDAENWECTHEDFGTLCDELDLEWAPRRTVSKIGRLKALPSAYAIAIPVSFDDEGEPDDTETRLYPTREAALAAYDAAIAAASAAGQDPSEASVDGSSQHPSTGGEDA